jgi:hypothetical protein
MRGKKSQASFSNSNLYNSENFRPPGASNPNLAYGPESDLGRKILADRRSTPFRLLSALWNGEWEQNDDSSTPMPSLVRYGLDSGIADERLEKTAA